MTHCQTFLCIHLCQPQGKAHVVEKTAFSRIPGIKMVTGFVIDPMHTLDGGLIRLLLSVLINNPSAGGPITHEIMHAMNQTITREPTDFEHFILEFLLCELANCMVLPAQTENVYLISFSDVEVSTIRDAAKIH
jgi:hypothetical protein